jgi:hypothetical protein
VSAAEWKSWPKVGGGKPANGKRYHKVREMGLDNTLNRQRCGMGYLRYTGPLRGTEWPGRYPQSWDPMFVRFMKPGDMGVALVALSLGRDGVERVYQRFVMAGAGPRMVGERMTADDFRGAR